ncbi:glycosyltransferase [Sulfurimonas sp.]|uniref:glycosyltransferase n=1 Tax=Sulfurimonas sp. TaxID=2022749 RepID=UPI002610E416|nr:glycosyltransferase [Sulfurimonas sp.]
MKLILLGDPNSVHIIKWAKLLSENKIDILIFGLNPCIVDDYQHISNIEIFTLNENTTLHEGALGKLKYIKAVPELKKIVKQFKPDILHAHYATSYGLLGALSRFHPFVLSVWGSDVFSFPNKSFLHRLILKYNLKQADKILSTSHIMAKETNLYTDKEIEITPFGIDMEQFKPMYTKENLFRKNDIIIGTVKALEEEYGIEYLIKAFKIVSDKHKELPLKLLIVGGGSLENNLKGLVKKLELENDTLFVGKVHFSEVPKYQNMLSVSVSVSDSESFGVAIIEASACAKPVVVSNVGGLPEVVKDGVTGIIVLSRDEFSTADAIEKLILDKELRDKMGENGRERIKKFYNLNDNVDQMINIYEGILK